MAETIPAVDWRQVEALKGSKLESLMNDYRELETEKADLEGRLVATRALIQEVISPAFPAGGAARIGDRVARWHGPSEGKRLDVAKLVKAGVTPDQLAKGYTKTTKKAYLEIRSAKEVEEEVMEVSPAG